MALTNAQYNAVMRDYERRQMENVRARDRRVEEVYGKLPEVRELDRDIASTAAASARRLLGGDGAARAEGRAELSRLRERKKELLAAAGYPADYMELRCRCPLCRDTGYADGKRCRCFEQERIRILYDQSNVSGTLARENFSTLSLECYDAQKRIPELGMTERAYMELVVRRCREFAEQFPEKGRNLLFTGGTGTGKTFLSSCIAKALIDRYIPVIYLVSQDFFDLLSRSRFGRDGEEDMQEACQNILDCDMLILDDLGTEMNNTFVSSQFFYCVNERIQRGKGTIISTNLSMTGLRDTYSDRVASRIMSSYRLIPLYGQDLRLKRKRV